jgi:hypothetical protein
MDHAGGLAYHAATRDLYKMKVPTWYVPRENVDDLHAMLEAFRRLDKSDLPVNLHACGPGDVVELGGGWVARPFRSPHRVACQGYALCRRRTRLLAEGDDEVSLVIGNNNIRVKTRNYTFTSKLVDGKFPDYDRVLPKGGDKVMIGNRNGLKQALSRAAILSNEKFRGIRLMLAKDELRILANNPEQEEAEDVVSVEYSSSPLEIGFNVSYLIDVLNVVTTETVQMVLSDTNSSVLMQATEGSPALFVVMPMRL